MASNINLAKGVVAEYDSLLRQKKTRAVLYRITPDFTLCEVDSTLPAVEDDYEGAWRDFVKALPEDDCRFVLYDFTWQETATIAKSKVILVLWSAETAPVRKKMIYSSSQQVLLNSMPEVQRQIQASDSSDLDFKDVKDKCSTS